MTLYKYEGAGNDFLIADGGEFTPESVCRLCDRHGGFGADGLMVLGPGNGDAAFSMRFFNPDGSGGMMCGNGGRCIAAFAADLGRIPVGKEVAFMAPDGLHRVTVLEAQEPQARPRGRTVRLEMRPVTQIRRLDAASGNPGVPLPAPRFLNTGTRHLVVFVPDVEDVPVATEGARWRHDPAFAPEGTNVNFVQRTPEGLRVRTFEKGVEAETLACGTGIVASALAAYDAFGPDAAGNPSVRIAVRARRGDVLQVEFRPENGAFDGIYLTGPTAYVGMVATDSL